MAQPAGVYFQFRADDAAANYSTTTSGIADTSGSARPNAVPTGLSTRPALTAGGSGGHSYVTFDGVDDRLTTVNTTDPSMLAFGNNKPGLTLAAVVKVDTAVGSGTTRTIAVHSIGGSNSGRITIQVSSSGMWNVVARRLDADAASSLVTTTPADNALHLLVGVNDYIAGQQYVYLDGVLIGQQAIAGTSGNTSATNSLAWSWGSSPTPAQFTAMDTYELLGYDRALTTTELNDLWLFEKARYAIPGAAAPALTATASLAGSGQLTASGSTVVTSLRVLRAAVSTSGAATLRVLRAAVATETAVQANAGVPVTADSLDTVVLSAEASSGTPTGYAWTQTSGPAVTLRPNGNVPRPEFTAPATDAGTSLGFSLAVTSGGTTSANTAAVTVTVRPHIEWLWIGGVWKPVLTEVQDAAVA